MNVDFPDPGFLDVQNIPWSVFNQMPRYVATEAESAGEWYTHSNGEYTQPDLLQGYKRALANLT